MDTKLAAKGLALAIAEKRQREVEMKSERRWRPSGNYASGLYDCKRAGYFNRVLWDERPPIPPHVQGRLEMGEIVHKWAQKWLMDNFNVTNVELPLNYEKWDLRGRVDAMIAVYTDDKEGRVVSIPVEIKSITDQAWAKTRSVEDLLEDEWTRKYVRQLWAYMLTANVDVGLLLFVGLPSGTINPVVVELDYERAEKEVAEWCEEVSRAVRAYEEQKESVATEEERRELAEKLAPAGIKHDPTVCGRCPWFGRHCFPQRQAVSDGLQILSDPEFVGDINRMKEIEPLVKDYDAIKKRVKARLEGVETAIAGNWAIKGKQVRTRRLSIPKQVQEQLKREHPDWLKEVSYWKHTIQPLIEGDKQQWAQSDIAARLRRILEEKK